MQTTQSLAGLTPTHTQALHLLLARLALTGRWRALSSAPRAAMAQPVTLDDHSEVDPRLPIPNRIVKRLCADDSGRTSVKVGHRQALTPKTPDAQHAIGGFFYEQNKIKVCWYCSGEHTLNRAAVF